MTNLINIIKDLKDDEALKVEFNTCRVNVATIVSKTEMFSPELYKPLSSKTNYICKSVTDNDLAVFDGECYHYSSYNMYDKIHVRLVVV